MGIRRIGIVGDGRTDRTIFGKIVQCLLNPTNNTNNNLDIVDLKRQSIRDAIDRYWDDASKANEYFLPAKPAQTLLNNITNTLLGAFNEFESEVGKGQLSSQDVLLITADAEKPLKSADGYFNEWASGLPKICLGAVEKFYQFHAKNYYPHNQIPLIIPVIPFPSTEVFILATQKKPSEYFEKSANDLKQLVYGTTNLSTVLPEDLKEKALMFITPETMHYIFQKQPESRLLIQHLSFGYNL